MFTKSRVKELYQAVKDNANHYTKARNSRLYGLSGDDFVKAYATSDIAGKQGFTDNFMSFCYTNISGISYLKRTTIERYMRANFARDYAWIKRNEQ